jgi:hypothetical protein
MKEGEMSEGKKGEGKAYSRLLDEETREHLRAARRRMRESYKSFLPPEFVEHRREARREMLLAARSLIDHALERMEARKEG